MRTLQAVAICFFLAGCWEQPPTQTSQPLYQVTALNYNHALIVNSTTGEVWYFVDAPIGVSIRYAGKLTAGAKPGEAVAEYKLF